MTDPNAAPQGRSESLEMLYRELVNELAALMVNAGLIGSIARRWPKEVQSNWAERLEMMRDRATQEIQEIQMFAEQYDET